MFDANVDALFHITVADLLVENDADGRFCHVVDNTGLAVVDFVGLSSACQRVLWNFVHVHTAHANEGLCVRNSRVLLTMPF